MPPLENHYSYGSLYFKSSADDEWHPLGSVNSFHCEVEDDCQIYYDPVTRTFFRASENNVQKAAKDFLEETKKEEDMKEKEQPKDKLDEMIKYLKTLRSIKGYLLVDDVLDIFDMKDMELTSEGKKVNPLELYCGNLDEYVRDMKFHRSVCLHEIKVSESIKEIRKLVDDIKNIDEALSKLEDDEE